MYGCVGVTIYMCGVCGEASGGAQDRWGRKGRRVARCDEGAAVHSSTTQIRPAGPRVDPWGRLHSISPSGTEQLMAGGVHVEDR